MAMTFEFGETVQILDGSAESIDDYGNDVSSWPVKATYLNVGIAPADGNGTGANEQTADQRDTVTIGLNVYGIPGDAAISSSDKAMARGQMWDIVGLPQGFVLPFTGWTPGMVLALRRFTG